MTIRRFGIGMDTQTSKSQPTQQMTTILLLWLILVSSPQPSQAFFVAPPSTNTRTRSLIRQVVTHPTTSSADIILCLSMSKADRDDNGDDEHDNVDFLDRPFFDPANVQDGSIFKWFADMVEQDYETAEALFASATIAVLVLVSQELLRFYVHGDHYVPFKAGGGGSLF